MDPQQLDAWRIGITTARSSASRDALGPTSRAVRWLLRSSGGVLPGWMGCLLNYSNSLAKENRLIHILVR